VIDLDDISTIDPELADAINENCRRYSQLFSQVVQEMLPELKDREVKPTDSIGSFD
jgi:DNA replication licensing factor MCM7